MPRRLGGAAEQRHPLRADLKLRRLSRTWQPTVAPPPEGWPDGDGTQVTVDEAGQPIGLNHNATGAVIEVVVDCSDGSLAFGVNGAPPHRVPEGWPEGYEPPDSDDSDSEEEEEPPKVPFKFPKGAQLRPYCWLFQPDDRVSFARVYL